MKKSKILLGALSLTTITPLIPITLTSCGSGTTDVSFSPKIEKDANVKEYTLSKTELNKAFSIVCTCSDGYQLDSSKTVVKIGEKTLTIDKDYIIYQDTVIVGSSVVTDKNVNVNLVSKVNDSVNVTITTDEGITKATHSATMLNTAFSVVCTLGENCEIDHDATTIKIGNKILTIDEDYIIHDNMIVVGSAAVTSKDINIDIKSKDVTVLYTVQLFASEGGEFVGGQTSYSVVQGTKWKDIPNKPTPTPKSGYKFVGWYRNETQITDETPITDNMDIYAWFEEESAKQCYVTVIASPGGSINGSTIIPIQSGTKWGNIKPTVTPDTGYEFENWYMNDKIINDDTIISSNSYVFAWFKSNATKCKIKFECLAGGLFDGTRSTEIEVEIGKTWGDIKNQAPITKNENGYVFKDWYVNQEQTPITDDTVFSDATYIFAYFEKTKLNIAIDMTDVQHASAPIQTISIDASNFNIARETLDKCVQPEDGYALAGWVDEKDNPIFDNYQLSTNKTIKPIIVEEYNTYELNETALTATVSGRVSGKDQTNLMIPSYIYKNSKWYKVTSIKFDNTSGYYMGSSTIKTLCIPNTINRIPDRAFRECGNLTTVYIPKSVNYFGYHSFYRTYKCTSFNYLGTIAEYKKITNGGWWHQGMSTGTTICIDGVTNIDADA